MGLIWWVLKRVIGLIWASLIRVFRGDRLTIDCAAHFIRATNAEERLRRIWPKQLYSHIFVRMEVLNDHVPRPRHEMTHYIGRFKKAEDVIARMTEFEEAIGQRSVNQVEAAERGTVIYRWIKIIVV